MPKIIEDCKERILASAKIELTAEKDNGFSRRRIASRAGVAVGTIYHYFPDKRNLIAEILLESWIEKYSKARIEVSSSHNLKDVLICISSLIEGFKRENKETFRNYKDQDFGSYYRRLHFSFAKQIAKLVEKGRKSLPLSPRSDEEYLRLAERVLIQSRDKAVTFDTLVSMISRIVTKEENHERQI